MWLVTTIFNGGTLMAKVENTDIHQNCLFKRTICLDTNNQLSDVGQQ